MSKIPSINYDKLLPTLNRDGWIEVNRKGSHIRVEKRTTTETLKITVPAHKPIKRSTSARILKQARISVETLNELL